MQTENYRNNLKDALENLIIVNKSIFDSLIPLAMQGELKDWNDNIPIGEVIQFDFELFKGCDDTNIQKLVHLIEKVEETFQSISNLNNIKFDDLNSNM
jgi:hypothetical protein